MIKPVAVSLRTESSDEYIGLIYCDFEDKEQTIQQLFTILHEEEFRYVVNFKVETNFNFDNKRIRDIIDDLIQDLNKGDEL